MINIYKKMFSSRNSWYALIFAYAFFSFLDYFFVKYIYELMIIDPDSLYFWYPSIYYYNYSGYLQGPQPVLRILFLILTLLVLYFLNSTKDIQKNYNVRAVVFFALYFIITMPSNNNISFSRMFIYSMPFSPVEKIFQDTQRNFTTEIVTTPFGKFKMHKKVGSINDKLSRLQSNCKLRNTLVECVDYPFKLSK